MANRDDSTNRPRVWHVGRRGDVAGGMTQVVNGYLAWSFDQVDVDIIVSRDGSSGLRAWRLFAAACRSIWQLPRDGRTALVVHLSQGGSFLREGVLLLLAHARGLPALAHLHGSRFVAFSQRWPRLVRHVLQRAERVIVLSDATRRAVMQWLPEARVQLVPNAVPEGPSRHKERLVVFGGAVTRRKGVDVLLAAWRDLPAAEGWQLLVAGPWNEPDLVAQPPAGVQFLGALPHDGLMALLDQAEVAVLPSRDEAMPMFILEAMARQACVLSTTVGGIPAVLSDGCGCLVEAGDVPALRDALTRLLSDDRLRHAIAQAGARRHQARFSARAIYPRMESLWLEAMAAQGKFR
jgi:glycosyltransferase involved in cell wall biosynthesis